MTTRRLHYLLTNVLPALVLLSTWLWGPAVAAAETNVPDAVQLDPQAQQGLTDAHWVLFGSRTQRKAALKRIRFSGDQRMVAPLVYALRFLGAHPRAEVVPVLEKITRQRYGDDWFRWMEWLQDRPEVPPIDGFDIFLSNVFKNLDPKFAPFIYPGVEHRIALHEIVWGGVAAQDGIPPLNYPTMIAGAEQNYLTDSEWVFGVSIDGDVRAYPYRFMDWHEMLNDTIGGQHVSLAYCTLCGSGILYQAPMSETGKPVIFGSSGLLYRSNKLMFDHTTMSLWNQFSGEPTVGKLAHSGIVLTALPLVTTTWAKWFAANPTTQVMAPFTGFERDYRPGQAYGSYFRDSALMFPAPDDARDLAQKAEVFGLRVSGAEKAWPLRSFRGGAVINDQVGVLRLVLIGDHKTRQVRAYRRGNESFTKSNAALTRVQSADEQIWQVTETALVGPEGNQLTRLPGHLAYWFAWHNYFGRDSLAN